MNKFDFEKFKEYVNTYEPSKYGMDKPDVIAKDMLYGIGICLDKDTYLNITEMILKLKNYTENLEKIIDSYKEYE